MEVVFVLGLVLLFVVRWRIEHRGRRRREAAALQMQHRPLSEFDARFPADRRLGGRLIRRRVGF